jgi:hypothetical protein
MTKGRKRRPSPANEQSDQSREHDQQESGQPGGGKGRRDAVGPTGVYPPGAENIPSDAEVRMAGSWGGGSYSESGGSELEYRDGELLGGTTAGPDGEPTIDIHGGGRGEEGRGTRGETRAGASPEGSEQREPGGESEDRDALRLRGLQRGGEEGGGEQ